MNEAGFNPRPPCGERRWWSDRPARPGRVSIHALLAESDWNPLIRKMNLRVSIHALLAESDPPQVLDRITQGVSIHALLAESDPLPRFILSGRSEFQSTPSLRRATPHISKADRARVMFQSTPSLRRATQSVCVSCRRSMFQSTPSLRRATAPTVHVVNQSCKRGFAPTSRRRHITYRLLFIMFECQSTFSNVLQESPTSRQFDVSLGLAQRPCQTALK